MSLGNGFCHLAEARKGDIIVMHSQDYTYASFRESVLKMLERFSSNGRENTVGEVKDIERRLSSSAGIHLRKLYDEFCIGRKRTRIVLEAPHCAYDFGSFTVTPDSTFVKGFDGEGLAYRLVASGKGQLVFLQSGATPRLSIDTEYAKPTEYRGLIDSFDADSQVVLTTGSQLKVVSLEIYSDFFGTEEDLELLSGKGTGCARLPKDLSRVLGIYNAFGDKMRLSDFYISDDKGTVSADEQLDGVYTVEYLAFPEEITEENAESFVISLPPVLFDALCYACAADVCPASDGDAYSKLTYKYREILANFYDRYATHTDRRNSFYGCIGRKTPRGRR